MFLYIDFVFRNFTEFIFSNSFLNEVFIRVYIYIYIYIYICVCVLVAQSSLTLCDPMDCSPPSSSVHEIFQARILDWVAISFSRGSSQPRDQTQVSCNIYIYNIISSVNSDRIGVVRVDILVLFQILVEELSTFHFWSEVKFPQLCLTLCDPMDYTVQGILQARILEWVAFPFYRGSSQPRNWTEVSCLAGRFFINWAMSHLILFCYCLFLLLSLLIFALYI